MENVVYSDTDSVIFKFLPKDDCIGNIITCKTKDSNGKNKTILLNSCLGGLTDELDGAGHITEFIGLAPKTYSYELQFGNEFMKSKTLLIFTLLLAACSQSSDIGGETVESTTTTEKKVEVKENLDASQVDDELLISDNFNSFYDGITLKDGPDFNVQVVSDLDIFDENLYFVTGLYEGKIYKYKGNYSYYLQNKEERIALEAVNLGKAKSLFKKELEWMRKQPKARTTKSKSRTDDFYQIKEKAHQRRQDHQVQLEINMERLGSKILELHNVSKSFGDKKILDGFNYVFKRGERIGIIGKNGTGKSSFLNMNG